MVQVFESPGFAGFRFFWFQVFHGPDFLGSRFFRVQVLQNPGFSGSRFFRVQVQGLGPGFRRSLVFSCLRSGSHIDFCMQCVIMTLAGERHH